MADTIPDEPLEEPVPKTLSEPPVHPTLVNEATVDDPSLALPAETAPAPEKALERPKKRGKTVAFLLAGLLGLVLVAAAGVYLFVLRYEPIARRHIPGNAHIAVRVEFAKILLFGPVRNNLWPLVEGKDEKRPEGPSRIQRIKEATGVDLALDLRELVLASADGTAWVAIVGGPIKPGRFVSGIAEVAKKEGWAGWKTEGELFVGPGGVAIGQAEDGAIVLGSNATMAMAALPASDEHKRLALAEDAAVTFAITRDAWSGARGVVGTIVEHAGALSRVERATGKVSLGASPEVTLRIEPRSGQDAATIAKELEVTLNELRIVTLLAPDVAGEKGALGQTRVWAEEGVVKVRSVWPYEGLDRASARLAGILRSGREQTLH